MAVGSFADHCASKADTAQNKRDVCHPIHEHFAVIWADVMHSIMTWHISVPGQQEVQKPPTSRTAIILRSHVVWRSFLSSQDQLSCPRNEGGISKQLFYLNWTSCTFAIFFLVMWCNEAALVIAIVAMGLDSSVSIIVQCLIFGRWNFQMIG